MTVDVRPELQRATTSDLPAVSAALEHDGAVVVEDYLSPDLLARINAELDDLVRDMPPGSQSDNPVWKIFHGPNTKRFTRLAVRTPSFWEVVAHPLLRAVCDELLLPSCGGYWLNTGQMMVVGPGSEAQWLHRDQGNWPFFSRELGPSAPEVTVSVMLALSDFTDEVGATRVIPGSHLWDDYSRPGEMEETIPAEMPAGSGMIYTGKVVHGAGANVTTDQWRRGLHVSFVLGWLTPEEANPLSCPYEQVRHLPEDVQRLLGWGSYDPGDSGGGRLWTVDWEDLRSTLVPELEG